MIREMAAGANAALTAENPGLVELVIGIDWAVTSSRGPKSELVPMVIVCGSNGKAISNDHVVFFNQLETSDRSVTHLAGDQEQIDVDLALIPTEVAKIVFLVYVDPEVRGPGTFGAVRAASIRVSSVDGHELVRFLVPLENVREVGAVIFGELYRHGADWKFRALGQGYRAGLLGVFSDFGIAL